ncbi:MAG TPA: PilN domain-containing protein [Burkholderiales bacterium]|nr:PilN domain-containing protein [Burkholderiales bacterium]
MIRFNLLPYREMRRAEQQRQFIVLACGIAILGLAIWFLGHSYLGSQLDTQNRRNKFLQQHIAVLDKQIAEIKHLKEQTAALLARKKVIETLQTNRSEVVHLLDQLARQMPDGVYLKSIKQRGNSVHIIGYAQSNARVSTLLRNFESSPWLEHPALIQIKAVNQGGKHLFEFSMNVTLTRGKDDEKKPASHKGRKT